MWRIKFVSTYCEIALRWMPLYTFDDKSTMVQVMAWCHQATGHYLSQCWPNPRLIYVTRKVNPSKPWLTEGLMKCIKVKNKLYKERVKSPSPLRIEIYKRHRNKLNSILRATEKGYYETLFQKNKNNLRKSWQIIKDIIGKHKPGPIMSKRFKVNSTEIDDPLIISNIFNEYFVNIGNNLANKIKMQPNSHEKYLGGTFQESMFISPVTKEEINSIISTFGDTASGWDDIAPRSIKFVKEIIQKPLMHICNLSFYTGIVPEQIKIARVVPIYKHGDPSQFNNYRPVSVLNVFSKVYERLFYNRLLKYLNKHKILYELQFGFREKHSTELALICLIGKIISAIERNEFTIAVFLDLSKAFYLVDHQILLKKLEHYDIRGVPLKWLSSYLSGRQQYVNFQNTDSDKMFIKRGVTQGSILGPLLFLVFINDLHNVSSVLSYILFADDSNLLFSGTNFKQILKIMKDELEKITWWFKSNSLCLNVNKTNFMVFAAKNKKVVGEEPKISIENRDIERVYKTKFLGVVTDSKLNWRCHIDYIANRISKNIGIIVKMKTVLNLKTAKDLYYSFIYPYLNYCCCVWGLACITYLSKLHIIQKRIARLILGKQKYYPSHGLFKELDMLSIYDINKCSLSMFCYKFNFGLLPDVFDNFFTKVSNVHRHHTRSQRNFHVRASRTICVDKSVKYRGTLLWNQLRDNVKNSPNFNIFKKQLVSFLRGSWMSVVCCNCAYIHTRMHLCVFLSSFVS